MSASTVLKGLGLNDKEIALYTALLKRGRTTPAQLAKATKINRATVYAVAKTLAEKGLLAEDVAGKTLHLVPMPVDNMRTSIERKKRELDERVALITEASRELSFISGEKEYPVPKMRFVPGHELEAFLYANTRKWQGSALKYDKVWWGFQDHSFVAL